MRRTMEEQYEAICAESTGFSSGFIDLDRIIGGFQKGSLNIIAAVPSMGSTTLALNIAQFGGRNEKESSASLIFSLDMSSEQIVHRMLSAEAEVRVQDMDTEMFNFHQSISIVNAFRRLSELPFFLSDSRPTLSTTEFRERAQLFKFQHENIGLIIVDYLQLMSHSTSRYDDRQREIDGISRVLKSVACELECPVLALSQLSHEKIDLRYDKRPMLSDLRDAGVNEHEQDVDVVMMLYREEYYYGERDPRDEGSGEALLNVAKNKNGALGEIKLVFKREFGRFFNSMR